MPGVDCTDNFSGVAHDITLRNVMIIRIVCGLDIDQSDVETVFLEGELSKEACANMSCPMGMNLNNDECLEVRKDMCGLHQYLVFIGW